MNCTDINECLTTCNGLLDDCQNTNGSFTCDCMVGYQTNNVTSLCEDIDECNDSNACREDADCVNTDGSFYCNCNLLLNCTICNAGFTQNFYNETCLDIDECSNSTWNHCHTNATCINMNGTYDCLCNPGYFGDGFSCITECPICGNNTECDIDLVENIASCICKDGYDLDQLSGLCVDTNECLNITACANQTCINTAGSYTCVCPYGYTPDNFTGMCIDDDECQSGFHLCAPSAICENTDGSYDCACDEGFIGNGYDCIPVCSSCPVGAECFLNGTYNAWCECEEGYFDENEVSCGYSYNDNKVGCVGNTAGLVDVSCQPGYLINVISAIYGRIDDTRCCTAAQQANGKCNACSGHDATLYTKVLCDKMESCSIPFNTDVFGDPCMDTRKTALIDWECRPDCNNGTAPNCTDIDECTNQSNICSNMEYCVNTPGSYVCPCVDGYAWNNITNTCEDSDECTNMGLTHCSANAFCNNTIGSYTCTCNDGYVGDGECCFACPACGPNAYCTVDNDSTLNVTLICKCHPGYGGNGTIGCTDIDECTTTQHNCASIHSGAHCENSEGSYICLCPEGYHLAVNGSCLDIDECTISRSALWEDQTNYCHANATCFNTDGSFTCQCNANFTGDGSCCREICPNCGENAYCTEGSNGDNICACLPGFQGPAPLGTNNCTDINECILNATEIVSGIESICDKDIDVEPPMICHNTDGSYICLCPDGYTQNNVTHECVDIDECNLSIHDCDINASCINLNGSYNCTCDLNYNGNGYNCKPECPVCGHHAYCTTDNLVPYETLICACHEGYEMDQSGNCTDIDECGSQSFDCGSFPNVECDNTEGSYSCVCPCGYDRNNTSNNCEDVNECMSTNLCHPNATCTNTVGTYTCECNPTHFGNGLDCIENCPACGINAFCTVDGAENVICECHLGYEGDPMVDCTDIDECDSNTHSCGNAYSETSVKCVGNGGGALDLTCPVNFVIKVISSVYGRINSDRCCTNSQLNTNQCDPCPGFDALSYLQELCDGQQSCDVPYNSAVFGDPCPGIRKHTNTTWNCVPMQECQNVEGGHACLCPDGYEIAPNGTCIDINECKLNLDLCHLTANCINTMGSYDCDCQNGYNGNGLDCWLECPDCAENAYCTLNATQDAVCLCLPGYEGVPTINCTDINECSNSTLHICDDGVLGEICDNTAGSYVCICEEGFIRNDTSGLCEDYNECFDINDPANRNDWSSTAWENRTHNCHDNATCANTFGSYTCSCNGNFYGDGFCCLQECDACGQNAHCTISDDHIPQCVCNSGYDGPSPLGISNCTDTNECVVNATEICQDTIFTNCQNTAGSFVCLCPEGYEVNVQDGGCDDIDECLLEVCHDNSTCTNNVGSYTCECYANFTGDGNCCQPECPDCAENGYCTADDNNELICVCRLGYEGDGYQFCIDINECNNATLNTCIGHVPAQTCVNTEASYVCLCPEGYIRNNTSLLCEDFDECTLLMSVPSGRGFVDQPFSVWEDMSHKCHTNATCTNTVGSYNCQCNTNFTGNGFCCLEDCPDCGANTYCTLDDQNEPTCICKDGFTGDPFGTCTDIDECSRG